MPAASRATGARPPGEPPRGQDPRDGQQYGPPGYGGPGPYGPPDQDQGYQGPNPGYPPQPYDAPGYGQRVWDQQGQQWEQQWGQQPPAQQGPPQGYPQQPYQQGQPQPNWDHRATSRATRSRASRAGTRRTTARTTALPAAAPQEITATLSIDDGSGRSHQLQRGSNVIGRGQDASFRLADTSVSRRHVDVYFDGQSAVLHDLGSTNGTTVNGSSVQTWQLADGDVIHIGHSTVVFSSRY